MWSIVTCTQNKVLNRWLPLGEKKEQKNVMLSSELSQISLDTQHNI